MVPLQPDFANSFYRATVQKSDCPLVPRDRVEQHADGPVLAPVERRLDLEGLSSSMELAEVAPSDRGVPEIVEGLGFVERLLDLDEAAARVTPSGVLQLHPLIHLEIDVAVQQRPRPL